MNKYDEAYDCLINSYDYFINTNSNSFEFYQGDDNHSGIIFSCPHSVSQTRNGKEKLADINTGPLGFALNKLGYSVLLKTKNCEDDANYDRNSKYKNFLYKKIKKDKFFYLIDLHGMSNKRNVTIALGTLFGKNVEKENELTKHFIKIASENNFPENDIRLDFPFYAGDRTISSSIHKKMKIETLQIEINSKIFNNREMIISLLKTLDEYAQKVKLINDYQTKSINFRDFDKYDFELLGDRYGSDTFTFKKHNSKILLTAPHATSMFKEGKICYQESQSGAILLALEDILKCSLLIKTRKTDYDSNDEYIENVFNYVNNNKTKYIIEFHIMNKLRPQDIVINTNNGVSINNSFEIITSIIKEISKTNFRFCIDYPFNYLNTNSTIFRINQKTNIPIFQFIINENIVRNHSKLKKLIITIQDIIRDVEVFL